MSDQERAALLQIGAAKGRLLTLTEKLEALAAMSRSGRRLYEIRVGLIATLDDVEREIRERPYPSEV